MPLDSAYRALGGKAAVCVLCLTAVDSSDATTQKIESASMRQLTLRLCRYALGERGALFVGFVALAAGSAINLFFPYFIRRVLNNELGFELSRDLSWVTALCLLLFAVQAVFFYIRHYSFQAMGYRIAARLRSELYQALLRQDVEFFDLTRVGDNLSRLSADTQVVQRALTMNVSVAVRYLLQVLGGVAAMFLISVRLSFLILLVIPVLVLGSAIWGKRLRRASRLMQDALGELNVRAEESMTAFRTVQAFAGPAFERARFEEGNGAALKAGEERTKVAALFSSSMVFFLNSALVILVAYGASLVLHQRMTIGDLTGFVLYGVIVAVSFGFLVNVWDEFTQALGASERMFQIMDQRPQIVSPAQPEKLETASAYAIALERVTFAYASRPGQKVLSDVTLKIPAGKTVALVGPSGAGKSTIAALIPRFYDPEAGVVTVQGKNVRTLDLDELRKAIAIVPQQPQVFSLSLMENIRYGRLTATDAEVEAAAKAANLDTFIRSLPDGYRTFVGDKGVQLSGGERQRLAIARAILKDAGILILDEATSSLDSENEALVKQALERLMHGRTTLIIAHRLSTISHADAVLVLQEGRIIQEGTHLELMTAPGLYKSLVEYQLLQ